MCVYVTVKRMQSYNGTYICKYKSLHCIRWWGRRIFREWFRMSIVLINKTYRGGINNEKWSRERSSSRMSPKYGNLLVESVTDQSRSRSWFPQVCRRQAASPCILHNIDWRPRLVLSGSKRYRSMQRCFLIAQLLSDSTISQDARYLFISMNYC